MIGDPSAPVSVSEDFRASRDDDEAFLDVVYERVTTALEQGASLSTDALLQGRSHLRGQVEELIQAARELARPGELALPVVNGFTLVRELGRGGMGVVYLARQDSLDGREVALKVLPASALASARARARFLAEANSLARIRHPHIVTVHDVVADAVVCAYAMEHVDGASLARVVSQLALRNRLQPSEPTHAEVLALLGALPVGTPDAYTTMVAKWGVAIARALAALHAAGFVHRDVKPSNILLRRDGTPLLADFGLIHATDHDITHSGQFVGTLAYASPEQLVGDTEQLDARSDVFSLGVTLYHALALHLPFDGSTSKHALTPTSMLRRIEDGGIKPLRTWNPRLPRDLETVIAKATESEPRRRYPSATEFADDLQRVLDLQPIQARPAGWIGRTAKLVRRNRALAAGLGAGSFVSLALAAALVVKVFVVPEWAKADALDARLALLDPSSSFAILRGSYWDSRSNPLGVQTGVAAKALDEALTRYDEALRWQADDAIQAERDAVAGVLAGEHASSSGNARIDGFVAYLTGDVRATIANWDLYEVTRDRSTPPDPLVEAALGILLLGQGDHGRALEKLSDACEEFEHVGFLTTYYADAAVHAEKLDLAERLIDEAGRMEAPDPIGTLDRVRADLLCKRERYEEAERLYRTVPGAPARLGLARLLEFRGRVREAVEQFALAIDEAPDEPALRTEYVSAMNRWWSSVVPAERARILRRALDEEHRNAVSFGRLLARYSLCRASPDSHTVEAARDSRRKARRSNWSIAAVLSDSSALIGGIDSSNLQTADLSTLAEITEVEDMHRWLSFSSYSLALRELQYQAWFSPWPKVASLSIARMHRGALPITAGALALASNTRAQSFQGLGDLPGGEIYSVARGISGDGTTIVGESKSSAGTQAVRLRNGVLDALADLPGGPVNSVAFNANFDGSVIVGYSQDATQRRPSRWDGSSVAALPQPTGFGGAGTAYGVSADGTVIAGNCYSDLGDTWAPFRVTNGALSLLQYVGQGGSGDRMSAEGDLIGGYVMWPNNLDAAIWNEGSLLVLPELAPGHSQVLSVSNDARVLVGVGRSTLATSEPCRWTRNGSAYVVTGLGPVPGSPSALGGAWACTYDGAVIVGWTTVAAGRRAFIWDAQLGGMRLLSDVLTGNHGLDLTGWVLQDAYGMTPDGSVIVGVGLHNGQTEGWVARLGPASVSSYCTSSTTTNDCTPSLAAGGVARVGAASGFTLLASGIEGQKNGMFFYGLAPGAIPWHVNSSSWLCVVAPYIRTTSLNSGGASNTCDGYFALDWSEWLAGHPGATGAPYGVGQQLYGQAWFRDPPAPKSTNLSNALRWTMEP